MSETDIGPEEASRLLKKYAQAQKIKIELTQEQMSAILHQWKADPANPAEITFYVKERPMAALTVASCTYVGDTCCVEPITPEELVADREK